MATMTVIQVDGSDKTTVAAAISAMVITTANSYGNYVIGTNLFVWKYSK